MLPDNTATLTARHAARGGAKPPRKQGEQARYRHGALPSQYHLNQSETDPNTLPIPKDTLCPRRSGVSACSQAGATVPD